MPTNEKDLQAIHPLTRDAWRKWLIENHQKADHIWFIRYKKSAGKPVVSFDEAVEEALCFGWIDSLPRKLDEERTMLYFAPRKKGSGWSRVNKERIDRMLAEGKMMEAGLKKMEEAKADGSWTKLDAIENLEIPDDLAKALADRPPAADYFDAFPRSVKRGILEWILNAKRSATREKRILQTAEMAQNNERANQWRK